MRTQKKKHRTLFWRNYLLFFSQFVCELREFMFANLNNKLQSNHSHVIHEYFTVLPMHRAQQKQTKLKLKSDRTIIIIRSILYHFFFSVVVHVIFIFFFFSLWIQFALNLFSNFWNGWKCFPLYNVHLVISIVANYGSQHKIMFSTNSPVLSVVT